MNLRPPWRCPAGIALSSALALGASGCCEDVREIALLDDERWVLDGWEIQEPNGDSLDLREDETTEIVCADVCPSSECELALICQGGLCDPDHGDGPAGVWVVCTRTYPTCGGGE